MPGIGRNEQSKAADGYVTRKIESMLLSLVLCAALGGCVSAPAATATPGASSLGTGTAVPTAVLTISPAPTPPPTPAPSPAPSPTPTPEPTPTPDPWAAFFSDTPVVEIKDPQKGPWSYRDKDLSITIKILIRNKGRENYVAEIYTRGPLPMNGFADRKNLSARKMPWYVARINKAVFGVTADYLTWKNNKKGVMIRNGKTYYDKKQCDTLAILPDGTLKLYGAGKVTAAQLLKLGVKDSYSFGPWLVLDGKVNPALGKHRLNSANSRCSIGMVEPGHYFFVVSRNVTLVQHANIYVELGCKLAYNLDGGNSSAMVFMGEQLNEKVYDPEQKLGQRPVPELIVVGRSDLVPGVKDPVRGYNK